MERYEQEKKAKSDLEQRQAGEVTAAASREKMKQGEQAEKQKAETLQKAKEKCESMRTNEVLYNNPVNNMSLKRGAAIITDSSSGRLMRPARNMRI
ncbi:MAG: hypothetical protein ABSB79_08305 [Syntrophales bacterium]|jgi:hypothetical protein